MRIHDDKVHKRLVKEIETALEKYTIEESDLEGSWNAHSKPGSTCGTGETEKETLGLD